MKNTGAAAFNVNLINELTNNQITYSSNISTNELLSFGLISKLGDDIDFMKTPHVLIVYFRSSIGINYNQRIEIRGYDRMDLVNTLPPKKIIPN
ncbi:hypothetical protein LBMAG27_25160 [Bacteroidota bacterium]|nr:hypothetical protein LBMAG27_25160 [Bacteroidota bacterium]